MRWLKGIENAMDAHNHSTNNNRNFISKCKLKAIMFVVSQCGDHAQRSGHASKWMFTRRLMWLLRMEPENEEKHRDLLAGRLVELLRSYQIISSSLSKVFCVVTSTSTFILRAVVQNRRIFCIVCLSNMAQREAITKTNIS